MKVSLVIPAYNAGKTIDPCLRSVVHQDFPDYEVIVVDDGSLDDTAQTAKKYPVKLIKTPHQGVSAARNAGFEASQGEIIIFVDSDCVVGKDLIVNMIGPLQDPEIGVTQAWWEVMNKDKLVPCLIHKVYEYLTRNFDYPDLFWGFCFAVRRELFDKVGKFDALWVERVDDDDFSYRVTAKGYKIKLLREVRVGHFFRETLLAHVRIHIRTAKYKFLHIIKSKVFTDQRATPAEYVKLFLHGFMVLAALFIPLNPIPFFVLLTLSLASHLPVTFWAMKDGGRYVLIIPFEFITKLSWVVGSVLGLATFLKHSVIGKDS